MDPPPDLRFVATQCSGLRLRATPHLTVSSIHVSLFSITVSYFHEVVTAFGGLQMTRSLNWLRHVSALAAPRVLEIAVSTTSVAKKTDLSVLQLIMDTVLTR